MYFFSYDSLTIYDGDSSTSPMMGKYCGNSIPPSHVSSSNEILINFLSDYIVTEAGFLMEYNPTGKQNTSIQNNTEYHRDQRQRQMQNFSYTLPFQVQEIPAFRDFTIRDPRYFVILFQ